MSKYPLSWPARLPWAERIALALLFGICFVAPGALLTAL